MSDFISRAAALVHVELGADWWQAYGNIQALPDLEPMTAHAYNPSSDPTDQGKCTICGGGPHTVWLTDREMALREAASAAKSSCVKCGGDGWQWGYELDEPPGDEAPRPDDTRYSCDGGGCKASAVILGLIKK